MGDPVHIVRQSTQAFKDWIAGVQADPNREVVQCKNCKLITAQTKEKPWTVCPLCGVKSSMVKYGVAQ